MQYFIYYRNFATKIQIIFEADTIFIVYFCNYDTNLCIFNYIVGVEIANMHLIVVLPDAWVLRCRRYEERGYNGHHSHIEDAITYMLLGCHISILKYCPLPSAGTCLGSISITQYGLFKYSSIVIYVKLLFHLAVHTQSKQFFPEPQYCYCTNNAEDKVGEIAFAKQFYIQQVADESTGIATNDANDKVQAASFTFATHDAIGNITNEDASQYRPSREFNKMF